MDGLIILNKPLNISSHDAVFKVKKLLKEKKVGHTGTLDPLASGVLIICIGQATKLSQYLMSDTKEYRAKIMLGKSTTTYDLEGEIVDEVENVNVTEKAIDETIKSFIGKSMQVPPIYSALKKDGKKLYEYALKGIEVEIEQREIEVFDAKRTSDIDYIDGKLLFDVDFRVSKGTYIRTLANDFGKKINVPSVLAGLVRTENSGFHLKESNTLEQIETGDFKLVSMIEATNNIFTINDSNSISKARNGMKISYRYIKENYNDTPSIIRVIDLMNSKLVAIYKLEYSQELNTKYYKADTVWN